MLFFPFATLPNRAFINRKANHVINESFVVNVMVFAGDIVSAVAKTRYTTVARACLHCMHSNDSW